MADPEQPIDLNQVNSIIEWVMGEYGMRPTQSSESSADGLPAPELGTTSTENTPPVE
jgi:hypothetical protein